MALVMPGSASKKVSSSILLKSCYRHIFMMSVHEVGPVLYSYLYFHTPIKSFQLSLLSWVNDTILL